MIEFEWTLAEAFEAVNHSGNGLVEQETLKLTSDISPQKKQEYSLTWPRMTTFTVLNGQVLNALNTLAGGG